MNEAEKIWTINSINSTHFDLEIPGIENCDIDFNHGAEKICQKFLFSLNLYKNCDFLLN